MNILDECKKVFDIEISQLENVRNALDNTIVDIVSQIHNCKGKIIVCGIGKAGHVARKISATFSSFGIASFFLHPAEGLHGDLGSVTNSDVVIFISNSGNSKELLRLLPIIKLIGCNTIAITSNSESELALHSDMALCLPKIQESCTLNLAPTSSTTVEMVIGDAIAVAVSVLRGFQKDEYALYHPEGTLGSKLLTRVGDIMQTGLAIPIVSIGAPMEDVIFEVSSKGFGAAIVTDGLGKMCGIVTDADIRRALKENIDIYTSIVDDIMTAKPICVNKDILAVDALRIMEERLRTISVLPVVDESGKLEGIIRYHDIIRRGIMI
jgi:arabinose-5-phosphate isomerase